jgi:ribonuclease Z
MKPLFHPRLVNDPFGDPGLYIDFLFDRRAILFDLGDLTPLSSRQFLKVSHAFVSHTHMDHFSGFDSLLRILLGREKVLHLYGPPGFLERLEHKLAGYTWNLVAGYQSEFVVRGTEAHPDGGTLTADFRGRDGFRRGPETSAQTTGGVLLDEETFRVRTAFLDHKIPCLAFALEEKFHVNVWRSGLERLGLPVGPWLRELKSAVARGEPDDTPMGPGGVPLGVLRAEALRIVPGQKIAYVTDVVYHLQNAAAIADLASGADWLFIEATFAREDAERAAEKYHLTSAQAGRLARRAGAKRLVPFHFSPKYSDEGDRLAREAQEAFEETEPTGIVL